MNHFAVRRFFRYVIEMHAAGDFAFATKDGVAWPVGTGKRTSGSAKANANDEIVALAFHFDLDVS